MTSIRMLEISIFRFIDAPPEVGVLPWTFSHAYLINAKSLQARALFAQPAYLL